MTLPVCPTRTFSSGAKPRLLQRIVGQRPEHTALTRFAQRPTRERLALSVSGTLHHQIENAASARRRFRSERGGAPVDRLPGQLEQVCPLLQPRPGNKSAVLAPALAAIPPR